MNLSVSKATSDYSVMVACDVMLNFVGITTFSILVLFWVLVCTGITFYKILNQHIIDMITRKSLNGTCYVNHNEMAMDELKLWKHQLSLVSRFVHMVNRYFGPVIVIAISHEFITFIITFYELVLAVQRSEVKQASIYGAMVGRELFFLSVLTWTSYVLQLEVYIC